MARKSFDTITDTQTIDFNTKQPIEKTPRRVLGERIRFFRMNAHLTQAKVAELTGVTMNAVASWEIGRSKPDFFMVPTLCKSFGITVGQLFGEPGTPTPEDLSLLKSFHSIRYSDREAIRTLIKTMAANAPATEVEKIDLIKIKKGLTPAAAGIGDPSEWSLKAEEVYIRDCPLANQADLIFDVNGQSMEPTLEDGSQIFVKYAANINPGQLGVFTVGNEAYVKEYQPDGLHSHNPCYPTMRFDRGDSVVLVGVVLGKVEKDMIPSEEEIKIYMDQNNE